MFWLIVFIILILYLTSNVFRFYLKLVCFYLILAISPIICLPLAIFRPKDARNNIYPSWIAYLVTRIYNIEWHVINGEALEKLESAVIVSNHQSVLDSLGLMSVYPYGHPLVPVMKKELLYTGPFGIFAYLSGCLFIDRCKSDQAKQQLNHKWKLWIYPEGTRNPERQMLPFKKGAFHVAIHAQIPIVPVVYQPFNHVYHFKTRIFNSGKLRVHVLPPIPTEGLATSDVSSLCEKVRNEMTNVLQVYNTSKVSESSSKLSENSSKLSENASKICETKQANSQKFTTKIGINQENLTTISRKL